VRTTNLPALAIPRHPLPLVLATLFADAAGNVGGVSSVLEVDSKREAVRAASSAVDHPSSFLVNPHTWLGVNPRSWSVVLNG
jgi:hypothetical protein